MASNIARETDDLRLRAEQLTDDSLESTRRTRQLAEQAMQTGVETMVALDEQGEQLERIDQHLDDINDDLTQAEKNIRELQKCCGCCVCPCSGGITVGSGTRKSHIASEDSSDDEPITSQPRSAKGRGGGGANEGPMVQRVLDDAREDEMEENLQAVAGAVGMMKNLALDMGTELGKQNRRLDDITTKADSTEIRTRQADRAVRQELRK